MVVCSGEFLIKGDLTNAGDAPIFQKPFEKNIYKVLEVLHYKRLYSKEIFVFIKKNRNFLVAYNYNYLSN